MAHYSNFAARWRWTLTLKRNIPIVSVVKVMIKALNITSCKKSPKLFLWGATNH